ncbi:hypothetical protein KO519_14225, partial [Paraglaciecola agarilytica]|uniref:hypothetical protein n=1 Tax=Paraglaciecola chathamensis TaxID=368405 RepID=UPI001C087FE3
ASECVQRFLIKASLCSNGCSLSNSENAEQKPLGHSLQASFKRAYTALHDFEREQLFIQSRALFKPF